MHFVQCFKLCSNVHFKWQILWNFEYYSKYEENITKMFMISSKLFPIAFNWHILHFRIVYIKHTIKTWCASGNLFGRLTFELKLDFLCIIQKAAKLATTFQLRFPPDCNRILIYFFKFQWNEHKTVDLAQQL